MKITSAMEMRRILMQHGQKYAQMQPQDAVKLCFQSEFGGGHMISNENEALLRLQRELAETEQDERPLLEEIGGCTARLQLQAMARSGLRPETVNGLFCAYAGRKRGTTERFRELLQILRKCAQEGEMPFSSQELEAYLSEYEQAGFPAVSHSSVYRALYAPAYRVVPEAVGALLPLLARVDEILRSKGSVRIAIDGMCGSGKSTIGAFLAEALGGQLLHMDDYFLPFPRKTPERLAEPGGNVDWERFREEAACINNSQDIIFRRYDCGTRSLGEPETMPPCPVRITEGSYSLHPALREAYDVCVWLKIPAQLQIDRILQRNGPEKLQRFIHEWIPMENAYAEKLNVSKYCHFVFDGRELIL